MSRNYIKGNKKRCNGPLHQGKYISLDEFLVHKKGTRKGKPFSQCRHCKNFKRYGDTEHGLVPYNKVKFIFDELVNRLGKAESARRLGVSLSFFYRHGVGQCENVRLKTVANAMRILKNSRADGEVRHKKSIRHGSAIRGRAERIVNELSHHGAYYNGRFDIYNKARVENRQMREIEAKLTT